MFVIAHENENAKIQGDLPSLEFDIVRACKIKLGDGPVWHNRSGWSSKLKVRTGSQSRGMIPEVDLATVAGRELLFRIISPTWLNGSTSEEKVDENSTTRSNIPLTIEIVTRPKNHI